MTLVRRVAVPLSLGLLRVRTAGAASLLVVAGIAAATAALAGVLGAALVAQDRALARAVHQLPPPLRAVRVGFFGVPGQSEPSPRVDAAARRELRAVGGREAVATVLLRESSIGGAFVSLGGVDGLARWVRVRSGRLPRPCRPARCEVLLVRGGGRLPRTRGLRIVVSGRGVLRSTQLFGDAVPAERNQLDRAALAPAFQRSARYHQPAAPPLLLAEGVSTLASEPALASSYRSYGWVLPLRHGDVRSWRIGALLASIEQARAALQARTVEYDLVAPTSELAEARAEAKVGARRLLLLGGQAAALTLAFAAFAATRLRRSARDGRRRLTWLGAPAWQVAVADGARALALGAGGVVLGWIGGAATARHSVLTAGAAGVVLLAALGAAAVVATALVAEARSPRILDAVALGLATAAALALARGAADTDELLATRGTGAVLLVLPAMVVAFAAIAT